MAIHCISTKGILNVNEDQHFIILNGDEDDEKYDKTLNKSNIFCIMDGHGGKDVSEFVCAKLSKYVSTGKLRYPLRNNTVEQIFNYVQKQLVNNDNNIAAHCGSTCLCVVQYQRNDNNYLQIINVGDCRAIICRNGIASALTKDHKPNWPDER